MNVLIDIILISVFAYFVFKFFRAGLFVSVLGIGKPIASVFLAFTFGRFFSDLFLVFLNNATSLSRQISEIISLLLAYTFVFVASYAIISIIINLLANIKIPIVSQIDKSLGAILGIFVGFVLISVISTGVFSALSVLYGAMENVSIMDVYNDSVVFKNVYNFGFLDFIKELI